MNLKIFLTLCAIVLLAVGHGPRRAHSDEYECFGAGRYDAMSRGLGKEDCPKPGQVFDSHDGHYKTPDKLWKKPEPKKPSWAEYTCDNLRSYLQSHTEAEARAEAVAKHLPQWVVRKAEKCMP
jgi:hypothetical protein